MTEARFTVKALDVGFVVTQEHYGPYLDSGGILRHGFVEDKTVACVDEAAVEEVLDKWDWQKVVGVPIPERAE